jgi:Holliday junction resolvase-like predicted endonuclease
MIEDNLNIIKASGEIVRFEVDKLKRSLHNSGANEQLIIQIIYDIKEMLYNGITTKEIYKKAFQLLKEKSKTSAARYKLKEAILELGPTGYPFEKYVARILEFQGYSTEVGVIVKGHCVNHEIDVIAMKDDKHFMIECKFHSQKGTKSNVKVPLYIHSRFKDVEREWQKKPGHKYKFHQGWVVTNTKFSLDAIKYGNCMNMHLLSWDYPRRGSLKERIEISGLHPITCLSSITRAEKKMLLDQGIVLCKELCENQSILKKIGISEVRFKRIIKESAQLCKN